MNDLEWHQEVNKVIIQRWRQLKDTLVMRDFVDYLIEKGVISLDYWIGLKTKQIPESERTEDFLALVIKFDRQKYQHFLDALRSIKRTDLSRELSIPQVGKVTKQKKPTDNSRDNDVKEAKPEKVLSQSKAEQQSQPKKSKAAAKLYQFTSNHGHSGIQETSSGDSWKAAKTIESQKSSEMQRDKHTLPQKTYKPDKKTSYSPLSTKHTQHVGIGDLKDYSLDDDKKTSVKRDTTAISKHPTIIEVKGAVCNDPCRTDVANASTVKSDPNATLRLAPRQSISLEAREQHFHIRELELGKKQRKLEEREETLKTKEQELLIRSMNINTVSSSSSLESEIVPDVNEQLGTTKQELYHVIDSRRSDEQKIDNLQWNVVDLNREVSELQINVDRLTKEKEQSEQQATDQLKKLRAEMTRRQATYNEKVNQLETKLKVKDSKCIELESNIDGVVKTAMELELRVNTLTSDRSKQDKELKQHQTAIRLLNEDLQANITENQILKKRLEETELEKADLETRLQEKDSECIYLKSNIKDAEQTATELEIKMETLENEKSNQEQDLKHYQKEIRLLKMRPHRKTNVTENDVIEFEERLKTLESEKRIQEEGLQQYQREISLLKKKLQTTETVHNDINKRLETTKREKAGLEKDVSTLQAQKKQLESEKQTLCERLFAIPKWDQNPHNRRGSFN